VTAALTPYWLHWLRFNYPDVTVSALLTRSAQRFVTRPAITSMTTGTVLTDDWDEPEMPRGAHQDLQAQSECFAVFPASLDYVTRLAGGRADTPSAMVLQTTDKPIVLAASLPGRNAVIDALVQNLSLRPNLRFARTVPAFSVSTKSWDGQTGFFLPGVIDQLRQLLDTRSGFDSAPAHQDDARTTATMASSGTE